MFEMRFVIIFILKFQSTVMYKEWKYTSVFVVLPGVLFLCHRQSELRYDHFEAMQVRDKLDSLRPVAWQIHWMKTTWGDNQLT